VVRIKKTKLIRVSEDFMDFMDNIKKRFKVNSNTEATRIIAKLGKKGKKGSILDFFPMLLILFIFGMCSMIGYVLIIGVEAGFAGQPLITNQTMDILAIGKTTIGYFDEVFMFILFGLAIAIIVGGFYMRTHPIFIGIGIFVLVFVLVVTGVISNAFLELSGSDDLSAAAAQFGTMILAWQHMPVIILLIAVILFTVMHSRPGKESGGGFE